MIRKVVSTDKAGVLGLIKDFHEESLKNFGLIFDEIKCAEDFDKLVNLPEVVAFVDDLDGEIVGMIAGIIIGRIFLNFNCAQELIWYVKSRYRRQGIKLLKVFESECRRLGCDNILMTGLADSKAESFYKLFGYVRMEVNFLKRIR